ncbi:MAG TPA: dihydrofolate reductase [Chloroflexi bacterium]|nr:dihydrofolate reductase [Chloroflexota bacterium]
MRIALIAAIGVDHAIAIGDNLPWRLQDDTDDFHHKIRGHVVLMGRKTFETIGHPLADSPTIVITRDRAYRSDAIVFHTIDDGIRHAGELGEEVLFILGGGQIYSETLPLATDLYLTHVAASFADATAFFPPVDWSRWQEVEAETLHFTPSERNEYAFDIKHYILKN